MSILRITQPLFVGAIPLLAAIALPLSAHANEEQTPSNSYSNLVKYKCANGGETLVRYEGDDEKDVAIIINDAGKELILEQVPSGSGSLYSNGELEWHVKAENGIAINGDKTLSCTEASPEGEVEIPTEEEDNASD